MPAIPEGFKFSDEAARNREILFAANLFGISIKESARSYDDNIWRSEENKEESK